jgi:hypothetical protein
MKLCLEARVGRFKAMKEALGKAVRATKVVHGFKVRILYDCTGKMAINFWFSKGSVSDVSHLEALTKNCTGASTGRGILWALTALQWHPGREQRSSEGAVFSLQQKPERT